MGITGKTQIEAIVRAVAPKPVNVLIGSPSRFNVQDLAAMGVRRVSLGGALARAAWGGFLRAARSLAELDVFDGFADATPHADAERYRRIGSGAVLDTSDPRGMDVAENILQKLYPAHSVQRAGGAMRTEAKPPRTLTPNTFNGRRHSSMAATNLRGSSFA